MCRTRNIDFRRYETYAKTGFTGRSACRSRNRGRVRPENGKWRRRGETSVVRSPGPKASVSAGRRQRGSAPYRKESRRRHYGRTTNRLDGRRSGGRTRLDWRMNWTVKLSAPGRSLRGRDVKNARLPRTGNDCRVGRRTVHEEANVGGRVVDFTAR